MQPKLIILDLFQRGLYFPLVLIFIATLIVWAISLMLGFILGNSNIKIGQLIFYSIIMAVVMFIKPFLNGMTFMVIYNTIFILILVFAGKINLLKSFVIIIANGLLVTSSTSIFIEPLLCVDKISDFLLSPYGVVVGVMAESIFPLIVLLFCRKTDFTNFFIKDKYTRDEVAYLAALLLFFITLYYTSLDFMLFFSGTDKLPKDIMIQRLVMGWLLVGATFLALIWMRSSKTKRDKVLDDFLAELEMTNAKKEVLRLKLNGKKLEEIAKIRGVALTTVKTQINEIKKELNIKDFKEVVDKIKK
ncbi:MAG: LuxR C-terminal-related transcriptional regulator [Firmicutes bacterium]|nr:LuxR C-terminal-related transcriptional regulator [Bacillota bacterium]